MRTRSSMARSCSASIRMANPPPASVPPGQLTTPYNYKSVLQVMVQRGASDLHLKVGRPPTLRIDGELAPLEMPALTPQDLKSIGDQIVPPKQKREFDSD